MDKNYTLKLTKDKRAYKLYDASGNFVEYIHGKAGYYKTFNDMGGVRESFPGQKLKTVAEKIIARRAPTAIVEAEERVKTLKAAEDAAKLALDAAVAATNAAILELRAVRKAAGQ